MKVAYNACFGGFGLSLKASTEYAKRKGITLTWYKQVEYSHRDGVNRYEKVTPDYCESFDLCASIKDLGSSVEEIPNECFYYESFDEKRTDKDLISIIEDMGEEANGIFADLKISEIPDGAIYEIDYYDGNEIVVPPRQTW